MNKEEFISTLRNKLSKFPQKEVEDGIAFYSEMIDDKIEDGISEEDAVKDIGEIDSIVSQIVAEIPLSKIMKEKLKPKRSFKAWEIVLIILGSPIWLPILLSVFVVIVALYASLWVVIISLWAVEVSLIVAALYEIVCGVIMMIIGDVFVNLALVGFCIFCLGLLILLFFSFVYITKALILLTKKIILIIKNSFVKKEEE